METGSFRLVPEELLGYKTNVSLRTCLAEIITELSTISTLVSCLSNGLNIRDSGFLKAYRMMLFPLSI